MSEPAAPTTTAIDDLGDLTLLVRGEPGTERRFLVSRRVMRLASPVWKVMLDTTRPFAEGSSNEVSLLDDDPDALCVLLNIAHLQFSKVPLVLSFPEFLSLAVLADKYDLVHLAAPFVSRWLPPLCNSVYVPKQVITIGEPEDRLFVARTLGLKDTFEATMRWMILYAKPDASIPDGDTRQNRPISQRNVPEGVIDYILEARSGAISSLIDVLYNTMDHIRDSLACKAADHKLACRASMYGSLTLGIVPLGLWPTRPNPSRCPMSVQELAGKLQLIHIYTPPTPSQTHRQCYPGLELRTKINEVLVNVWVPDESHIQRMEERAFVKSTSV